MHSVTSAHIRQFNHDASIVPADLAFVFPTVPVDDLNRLLDFGDNIKCQGAIVVPGHLGNDLKYWDERFKMGPKPTSEQLIRQGHAFMISLTFQEKIRRGDTEIVGIKPWTLPIENVEWVFTTRTTDNGFFTRSMSIGNPVLVKSQVLGKTVTFYTNFRIAEHLFGLRINEDLTVSTHLAPEKSFPVEPIQSQVIKEMISGRNTYYSGGRYEITVAGVEEVYHQLGVYHKTSLSNLFKGLFRAKNGMLADLDLTSIKKTHDVVFPIVLEIGQEDPVWLLAYRCFAMNAQRTIDSVKVSTAFNESFAGATTKEQVKKVLDPIVKNRTKWREFDELFRAMPGYTEKRKRALRSNTNRAFNKLMEDFEFLNLDMTVYPKLYQAVQDGDIPVSTFFRKKEQYFLLNDNFALWEKMLELHYTVSCQLAKEVSARTTYEKDLMSYFYFVLHGLPEYLEEQTGEEWTCVPKLVNSSKELDPPAEDEKGIARSRSALTPEVDNDKKVVIVPYASLAMPGRQTTYCYSHDYNVLKRGFSFGGNVVMKDIEQNLNGKDNYGLMFYTFTGSPQGRGYPTFLIIFEQMGKGSERVHFHRTHPCRSKDGDYNPVHNWIRVAYNWMAGNVHRDRLKVQQGDLIFASIEPGKIEFHGEVNKYDNHEFKNPVAFSPYLKKEKANILGYVRVDEENVLQHNEHDNVKIPAGEYEIRQCRSWEANPKGIWTLNID